MGRASYWGKARVVSFMCVIRTLAFRGLPNAEDRADRKHRLKDWGCVRTCRNSNCSGSALLGVLGPTLLPIYLPLLHGAAP